MSVHMGVIHRRLVGTHVVAAIAGGSSDSWRSHGTLLVTTAATSRKTPATASAFFAEIEVVIHDQVQYVIVEFH